MLGEEKQQQCLEWLCSQDSKPGLFNGTTQVSKTLSSYSRVLCSLQCNSKSRGELEKVIVGFNKGLAVERRYWVTTKVHSQTCRQNTMWHQVQFNKHWAGRRCCWNKLSLPGLARSYLLFISFSWMYSCWIFLNVTPPPLNAFLTSK